MGGWVESGAVAQSARKTMSSGTLSRSSGPTGDRGGGEESASQLVYHSWLYSCVALTKVANREIVLDVRRRDVKGRLADARIGKDEGILMLADIEDD